jgi:gamma-glutamylaminecyclotransferase
LHANIDHYYSGRNIQVGHNNSIIPAINFDQKGKRFMSTGNKIVFICGSALRGQPNHDTLSAAPFLGAARSAAKYRLHSVQAGWHPGIYATPENGISIPGELYEMTSEQFAHLEANEPPHMYAASIELDDGTSAIAFFYPQELIESYGWPDISDYGGWANYKAAQATLD